MRWQEQLSGARPQGFQWFKETDFNQVLLGGKALFSSAKGLHTFSTP
jgi:hypothetical protein